MKTRRWMTWVLEESTKQTAPLPYTRQARLVRRQARNTKLRARRA